MYVIKIAENMKIINGKAIRNVVTLKDFVF